MGGESDRARKRDKAGWQEEAAVSTRVSVRSAAAGGPPVGTFETAFGTRYPPVVAFVLCGGPRRRQRRGSWKRVEADRYPFFAHFVFFRLSLSFFVSNLFLY